MLEVVPEMGVGPLWGAQQAVPRAQGPSCPTAASGCRPLPSAWDRRVLAAGLRGQPANVFCSVQVL